jgi:desulfoferrodoxin (superoxide reductase-like protein)
MNRRDFMVASGALVAGLLFLRGTAWANKAETKIEVPQSAPRGSEITIRVTVIHSADNFFHHVEWLWVQMNGQEIDRWEYSPFHLPEGATFTKEIKYVVDGDMEIIGKSSCNLHGSAGPAVVKVKAT